MNALVLLTYEDSWSTLFDSLENFSDDFRECDRNLNNQPQLNFDQCPECKSNHINKNGQKKGKQNYICVNCQRQFLDCYQTHRGYSDAFKRECLTMYVNGIDLRAIARVKGVSHVAIMNWVKQFGELLQLRL